MKTSLLHVLSCSFRCVSSWMMHRIRSRLVSKSYMILRRSVYLLTVCGVDGGVYRTTWGGYNRAEGLGNQSHCKLIHVSLILDRKYKVRFPHTIMLAAISSLMYSTAYRMQLNKEMNMQLQFPFFFGCHCIYLLIYFIGFSCPTQECITHTMVTSIMVGGYRAQPIENLWPSAGYWKTFPRTLSSRSLQL